MPSACLEDRKAMKGLETGQLISVLSTDPASPLISNISAIAAGMNLCERPRRKEPLALLFARVADRVSLEFFMQSSGRAADRAQADGKAERLRREIRDPVRMQIPPDT